VIATAGQAAAAAAMLSPPERPDQALPNAATTRSRHAAAPSPPIPLQGNDQPQVDELTAADGRGHQLPRTRCRWPLRLARQTIGTFDTHPSPDSRCR
jgi:hypothetical protein